VQTRKQLAQTCVVEFHGGGPQIMHLDDFTQKRIEESQDAQHELARDAKTRLLMNRRKNFLGELSGGYQSGTSDVPRLAISFLSFRDCDQRFGQVRDEDELVWRINWADHVSGPAPHLRQQRSRERNSIPSLDRRNPAGARSSFASLWDYLRSARGLPVPCACGL